MFVQAQTLWLVDHSPQGRPFDCNCAQNRAPTSRRILVCPPLSCYPETTDDGHGELPGLASG